MGSRLNSHVLTPSMVFCRLPSSPCCDGRAPQLDKYTPFVTLIDDVLSIKARGLFIAGFAAALMLACFTTAMYVVERHDVDMMVEVTDDDIPVRKSAVHRVALGRVEPRRRFSRPCNSIVDV